MRFGQGKARSGGSGAHRLEREGWANYVWSFHDNDEIGPVMLARIAKQTGLAPENL